MTPSSLSGSAMKDISISFVFFTLRAISHSI
jgi:hypothetical protein